MSAFFVSYTATGAIYSYLQCPASSVAVQTPPAGGGFVALPAMPDDINAHAKANYVLGGVITPKSAMGLTPSKTTLTANGTDSVVISGIPSGAVATVTGVIAAGPVTVTVGTLTITCTKAGAINCTVTNDPAHLPWSITLNAS